MPEPPTGSPAPQTALGSRLVANLEALLNDVEQARELAADFQGQVTEKNTELERIKALLVKTQEDLTRMDGNVQQLRKERHALANQVMRAEALDRKLSQTDAQLQTLQEVLRLLRGEPGNPLAVLRHKIAEDQREIDRLKGEILLLRQPGSIDHSLQKELAGLRALVATLEEEWRKRERDKPREVGLPERQRDAINLSSNP